MSKYTSLNMYFLNFPDEQNEITLSFENVEKIIGDELPHSAYIHRAWWSNEKNGVHVSAHAWMDAGWKVDTVNQREHWVRFVRTTSLPLVKPKNIIQFTDTAVRKTDNHKNIYPINASELKAGIKAFRDHEARDAMYKIATFLVKHFWGNFKEMANGMGVLLLTWNQAFYRYGMLDFSALECCLINNWQALDFFRNRNILSFSQIDNTGINHLYEQFLVALQIADGKAIGKQSPVAVSKALHLLAPAFFPLWDDKIARAYNCHYRYIPFMVKIKTLAEVLATEVDLQFAEKTLLKLIDEYNYAKFTKAWI